MKNNKARENETMANLNSFSDKISKGKAKGWMSEQVTFHVDSEKAYHFDKTRQQIEGGNRGRAFE
jgi:hypothetical protein